MITVICQFISLSKRTGYMQHVRIAFYLLQKTTQYIGSLLNIKI